MSNLKLRNVLSLFDGVAAGKLALERAGVELDTYYSSEIDETAIQIAEKNHDIISLGDVNNWREWNLKNIDLIMGGSPCTGFSSSGNQLNFDDPQSKLFFTMVEIIAHYKPKFFLLENVDMRDEWKDIITHYMGVEPVELCSSLVSAQERPRVYWANWKIDIPVDRKIRLKDILAEDEVLTKPASIRGRKINPDTGRRDDYNPDIENVQCIEVKRWTSKMGCLTTVEKDCVLTNLPFGRHLNAYTDFQRGVDWRYLQPVEAERLQTFPDGYTDGFNHTVRKTVIGNSWTVDMIAHILSCIYRKPSVISTKQTTLSEW